VIMQDEPPEAGDRAGKSLRRDERWDNRRVSFFFFIYYYYCVIHQFLFSLFLNFFFLLYRDFMLF